MHNPQEHVVSTILKTPVLGLIREFLRDNSIAVNPCEDRLKITPEQEASVLQAFFPSEETFDKAMFELSASFGNPEANIIMYLLSKYGTDTEGMQEHLRSLRDSLILWSVDAEVAITVRFDLQGESVDSIRNRFQMLPDILTGNGMITGHTNAELDALEITHAVSSGNQLPDDSAIQDWLHGLIDEGNLPLEKVIDRLVSFGNMSPLNFAMTAYGEMMPDAVETGAQSKQDECVAELLLSMKLSPECESIGQLRDTLSNILPYLSGNGLLSGDLASEVISQDVSISVSGTPDEHKADHDDMVKHAIALFDIGRFMSEDAIQYMVKFGRMTPQTFYHALYG